MACPSNSTRRSCPFNAQQPFLLVHCLDPFLILAHAHAWPSLDSSKPAPKELEVSGSGSGTVGTEAWSFLMDSTSTSLGSWHKMAYLWVADTQYL